MFNLTSIIKTVIMGAETPFVTREDIEDPITISQFRQYRDICIPQEWRAPVAGVKIGGAMYGGISNRMVAFYPLHGRFDFLGEILFSLAWFRTISVFFNIFSFTVARMNFSSFPMYST